jgi:hypothetical protein
MQAEFSAANAQENAKKVIPKNKKNRITNPCWYLICDITGFQSLVERKTTEAPK